MEVVAALASVAQLAGYTLKLIGKVYGFHQNIKGRPAKLLRRARQLEGLRLTVQELIQDKTLRASAAHDHLQAIIRKIKTLNDLLEKELIKQTQGFLRKYCKAWVRDRKEQRILDIFDDIEIYKSALLLSIAAETHARILSRSYTEMPSSIRKEPSVKAPTTNTRNARIGTRSKRKAMSEIEIEIAKESEHTSSPPNSDIEMGENENADGEEQYGKVTPQSTLSRPIERKALEQCQGTSEPHDGHRYEQNVFGDGAQGAWGNAAGTSLQGGCYHRHLYEKNKVGKNSKIFLGDIHEKGVAKAFLLGK